MNSVSVAVIGAGLAGLACARRLSIDGCRPVVFERQRAPGGRLATRSFEGATFDHGAQYLTVRDSAFREMIAAAAASGTAARWQPDWPGGEQEHAELWVGTPTMNALPRFLARDLDIEYATRVTRLARARGGWTVIDDKGAGVTDFGFVALALPAPEAAALAAMHTPLAERVGAIPMAPCWAVMVGFEGPVQRIADAGFTDDAVLPWIARNGSKPGRHAPDTWVLHASADFSRREFDAPPARVQTKLLERFAGRFGQRLPRILLADSHRWRHARVETPLGEPFLIDPAAGIGFCGDWCLDARGEAAFLSGSSLGAAIGAQLSQIQRSGASGKMRGER